MYYLFISILSTKNDVTIHLFARNGTFTQLLTLRIVTGEWASADMNRLLMYLLGLLGFAVVMNIIGWTGYYPSRSHKGGHR
jgi:hypothetical protein